jgi:hypothetical protein
MRTSAAASHVGAVFWSSVNVLWEWFEFLSKPASFPRIVGPQSSAGDAACTFSPAINAASERLLEDSATVPSDFQARLTYYSMQKELKQQAAAELADSEACTFRPDTGNAVAVLALSTSRAGHLLESKQAS